MKLSTADKQYITRKLHHAQNLFTADHTAAGLTALGHVIAVVSSSVESSPQDPLILDHADNAELYGPMPGIGRCIRGEIRQKVEESAVAAVKPMCASGLLAAIRDGGKSHPCFLCGLSHTRRVVVVPMSGFALEAIKHSGEPTVRISGQYRIGDRIAFSMPWPSGEVVITGDVESVDEIETALGTINDTLIRIIK